MRTQPDALLSMRRWVASILPGPPWRVLLAGDQGRVQRPYAIVAPADGATVTQDGPQVMKHLLPITVMAFPQAGSRPSASRLLAERVAAAFDLAIRAGVSDYADAGVRGHTRLIPLWDYGGVNPDDYTDEAALDTAATFRLAPDYLRVSDGWKASSQAQADEGELFVALLEARVQWFSPAGLRSDGKLLSTVRTDISAR